MALLTQEHQIRRINRNRKHPVLVRDRLDVMHMPMVSDKLSAHLAASACGGYHQLPRLLPPCRPIEPVDILSEFGWHQNLMNKYG